MLASVTIGASSEPVAISSVSITRSLEAADSGARCQTFDDRRSSVGERLAISMEGIQRFAGTVEQWAGSRERGYQVTGRSTTTQLGLFDALQTEVPRQTSVAMIARSLAERAGVSVVAVADEPVDRFKIKRGQSYQRALQELCEVHGFVLTSDAQGRAVLFRIPESRVALEVWELGQAGIREITISPNIQDWRDVIICRGQRSPVASDLADAALGEVGADIVAGLTRPSRRVLDNGSARSKAAARRMVADEARKAIASALTVDVDLVYTQRIPGDIVRIKRDGFDQSMIISTMEWSASTREIAYKATCVPIAAYDFTGQLTANFADGRAV